METNPKVIGHGHGKSTPGGRPADECDDAIDLLLTKSTLSRCDLFGSLSRVNSVIPMMPFIGVLSINTMQLEMRDKGWGDQHTEFRATYWPRTRICCG